MPELEVRYQRLAGSAVKFPGTSVQTWGEDSILPQILERLEPPCSLHLSGSKCGRLS